MLIKILLYTILIFYPHEIFSSDVFTVSGKITSKAGQELIGANVIILGTSNGAATNINGDYSLTFLQNPFENKSLILKVSYIGYQSFIDTLTFDDIGQDFSNINYSLSADVMAVSYTHLTLPTTLVV